MTTSHSKDYQELANLIKHHQVRTNRGCPRLLDTAAAHAISITQQENKVKRTVISGIIVEMKGEPIKPGQNNQNKRITMDQMLGTTKIANAVGRHESQGKTNIGNLQKWDPEGILIKGRASAIQYQNFIYNLSKTRRR